MISTHNKKKATRSALRLILKEQKRKKTRQTGAHQQIQKNCANEKIKAERKMQSFANKAIFFQATNGGQKKDKCLFLDPNKKIKVKNGMWLGKRCSGV